MRNFCLFAAFGANACLNFIVERMTIAIAIGVNVNTGVDRNRGSVFELQHNQPEEMKKCPSSQTISSYKTAVQKLES